MVQKSYTVPRWAYVIIGIGLVLIVIRAFLPLGVKAYINNSMRNLPGYSGSVADVDLYLLRGGMAVNHMNFFKDSMGKTPLFKCQRAKMFIHWNQLFKGRLVGSIDLVRPQIHFVATSTKDAKHEAKKITKQTPAPPEDLLAEIPFRIDAITVHNGRVDFKKLDTSPPIHVFFNKIESSVVNLTNSKQLSNTLIAQCKIHAMAMGQGNFDFYMAMNPLAKNLNFDLKAKLLNLPIEKLNAITKEYGKFDFEKGNLDLITEVAVRNGNMDGYVKPLFQDVEVAGDKDRRKDKDNFFQRVWENIVGAGEELVENQPISQSGTKIPLKGSVKAPKPGLIFAALTVLENAFVQALLPNYEPGDAPSAKAASH